MQRGLALFAAQYVRVSAVSEEPANALTHLWLAFDVMPREQEVECSIPPVADKVEVHARLQEQLERFLMKELGCMKHRLAVGGIRARVEQYPGERQYHAGAGDGIERGHAITSVLRVGVSAGIEKQPSGREQSGVALSVFAVERREAEKEQWLGGRVAGLLPDASLVFGNQPGGVAGMPERGGNVQALSCHVWRYAQDFARPILVLRLHREEERVDGIVRTARCL